MTTKHIVSAQVATESTFCSVAAATGIPSDAGLTFSTLELLDRAQITMFGDPALVERMGARTGLYALPPEPATTVDGSGDVVQRRTGSITIDMPWRPIGDGTAYPGGYSSLALGKLLNTGFSVLDPPDVADVVAVAGTTVQWSMTVAANARAGGLIQRAVNGRHEYSAITGQTASPVTECSPAFTAAVGLGETIRMMRMYYLPADGVPSTTTVALRLDGDGWRADCYGCALTSMTLTVDEASRMARLSMTLDARWVEYDAASASPVATVRADGAVAHQLQSYLRVSTVGWTGIGGPADPAQETATTLCADAATLSVEWTRAYPECGSSAVGYSGSEVVDVTASLEVLSSSLSAAAVLGTDTDLWDGRSRNVLLGLGGGQPGAVGEGGCVYLPAAHLTDDSGRLDAGKDYLRARYVWAPGPYGGDEEGIPGILTDATNSPLRIGLPL